MKLLVDFFPIILFFVAFKVAGIYAATAIAIAATVAQLAWLRVKRGRIEPMQWLSLGVIVVFGGATLVAHDETFIKWKPTILYWAMGAALLFGQLVLRRNLLKSVMGAQMELPEPAWRQALWMWVAFFAGMGALNLWVAFHFDTDTWVNFKLFGGMGLMAVFVVAQALYLGRFMREGDAARAIDAAAEKVPAE